MEALVSLSPLVSVSRHWYGDSGNIGTNGTNDDPLKTMTVHRSYNGTIDDDNTNGDNGENNSYGDSGNIGTNDANDDPFQKIMIRWLCNDANGDNNTKGDNGTNGDTIGTIE